MKPYSEDFRERIITTIRLGAAGCRRFLVRTSFITRLLHRHRTTGKVEPQLHDDGNPAVLGPKDMKYPLNYRSC